MIYIKNTQRTAQLDLDAIKKDLVTMLNAVGYSDFDLSVWFTSDKTIRTYNKEYRNKDKATDVISFPYHADVNPGERIVPQTDDDKNLGDILISVAYVKKDAPRWGQSLEERIRVLLVHSVCHLLGYDHIDDADYDVMKKEEERILALLN